jgi:hypothetical protein
MADPTRREATISWHLPATGQTTHAIVTFA